MIQINLVPVALRKKKGTQFLAGNLKIPMEVLVGTALGLVMLLVCAHVLLIFLNVGKVMQHKSLQAHWEKMQPEKKKADEVVQRLRELQARNTDVVNMKTGHGLLWSQKLNIISDALPKGVWIKKISLKEKMLFIEGSSISRQKREMSNVHAFTSALKNEKKFLESFSDLELGSIQRRNIQNLEVVDFLITTKIKE
jgi:Tfp pilus assembly protein PilN